MVLTSVDNDLDGVTPSNGNLRYGTFNNEVVRYAWNQGNAWTMRDQERVELTPPKLLFQDNWYRLEVQVLAGYSELYNKISSDNSQTRPGLFSFNGPPDLNPIGFATQRDRSHAP